ncbi:MAG TPA: class I SAM-dependent methyltransferase, partial [Polyangiaceae bacterium LLY-WYZ-15_(1-7)]|nr:class I SAM-dependent methyltransferase [Polyangiaceae bacterium LLY-WYZ-15_(1-7)]
MVDAPMAEPEEAPPAQPVEPSSEPSVVVRGTVRISSMPPPMAVDHGDDEDELEPDETAPVDVGSEPPEAEVTPLAEAEAEVVLSAAGEEEGRVTEEELDAAPEEAQGASAEDDDAPELEVEAADLDEEDLTEDLVEEDLDLEEAEELELDEVEASPAAPAVPSKPPPPPEGGEAAAPPAPPAAPPAAPRKPKQEKAPAAPPAAKPKKRRRPWFETFFSDDYLRTVRPPTPKEVARECDAIERALGLAKGATILDVGCGLGVHAIELTRRGYLVVGLDLSLPMLSRASDEAQAEGLKINFLHGDMREMTFDGSFDAVLCWGTTFGYFDDETNKRVLEQLYRALKPKGVLLLDVVNRDFVIQQQPNLVWFEGDGCVCMEESKFNYFTSRLEVKRTVILDDGRQRESVYTLRLYPLHELGKMMHTLRFRVAEVSGMMATPGVFFGADSPRLIIV